MQLSKGKKNTSSTPPKATVKESKLTDYASTE
jgi:hypothetical protein